MKPSRPPRPNRPGPRPRRGTRRGSILILALLASASASIAGLYLVLVSDLRVRRSSVLARLNDADRAAASGLQLARYELGLNPGFTGFTFHGKAPGSGDGGTAEVSVDINLTVTPTGALRATGTSVGSVADATFTTQADLRAPPHAVLQYNLFSNSSIMFKDAALKGFLRANGNVTVDGRVDFFGALETTQGSSVTSQIESSQVRYTSTSLAAPALPVSTYVGLASELVGVPLDPDGALLFERVSLRPNANPYGALNAQGAYCINAQSRNVILRDVYIKGSLTIHNAGLVLIEHGLSLEPADASLASLLVQGNLELKLETDLSETASVFDFNGDGDLVDVFPPSVTGLVHVSGTFTGPYGGQVTGTIVAGALVIAGLPKIENCLSFDTQPIVGYTLDGPWNIQAGSIQGSN